MRNEPSLDELRQRAREACERLRRLCEPEDAARAKPIVEHLRNAREYGLMGQLAEEISGLM
jgi:hypothetical protein